MNAKAYPLYLAACLSMACYPSWEVVQEHAPIPEAVWNLEDLNSPYDDRNMAGPPTLREQNTFVFSSSRASEGAELDLVPAELNVQFDQSHVDYWTHGYVHSGSLAVSAINRSGSNERGPRILPTQDEEHDALYVFASDRAGSYDVYALHAPSPVVTELHMGTPEQPTNPRPQKARQVPGLADPDVYEAYLSPLGEDRVLFATDRGGKGLDVYQAHLQEPGNLVAGVHELVRVDALSSDANDSFPYVNGNVLVFASDRDGGEGGYDLYSSTFDGTGWSEPKNLGPTINSEHDERRPVFICAEEFQNDLLIFSSDRPGGQGGFDLYAVGVSLDGSRADATPTQR